MSRHTPWTFISLLNTANSTNCEASKIALPYITCLKIEQMSARPKPPTCPGLFLVPHYLRKDYTAAAADVVLLGRVDVIFGEIDGIVGGLSVADCLLCWIK